MAAGRSRSRASIAPRARPPVEQLPGRGHTLCKERSGFLVRLGHQVDLLGHARPPWRMSLRRLAPWCVINLSANFLSDKACFEGQSGGRFG